MDILAGLRQLTDRLYAPNCVLCGGEQRGDSLQPLDICCHCYQRLPFNTSFCSICALPLPEQLAVTSVCGRCQKKKPAFDYSLSIFRYEQPVLWLVQQLKFNQRLLHSRLLGEIMRDRGWPLLQAISASPQCLLPVPLSAKRLRERGFNQSIELARPLLKSSALPLLINSVERSRNTDPQTGLDAKQRRKNIKGAFQLIKAIPYDHVLIVDDVVTTGSTVNELARLLKKEGVKRIGVLSAARAPMK